MSVLSPELLGIRNTDVNLRQVLCDNATNRKHKLLTTFVPDHLIFLIEQKVKVVHFDFVVLLYIEFSSLSFAYEEFCNKSNNESCEFSKICNALISKIIEQIYNMDGDVFTITDNGILSIWAKKNDQPVHELMHKVISCCLTLQEIVQKLKGNFHNLFQTPLKCAISAGSITFSIIGTCRPFHYVIIGEPLTALRRVTDIYKPQDIILSANAWEHCNLNDYNYVILDKSHIKITRAIKKCMTEAKVLQQTVDRQDESDKIAAARHLESPSDLSTIGWKNIKISIDPTISLIDGVEEDIETNRPVLIGSYKKRIGMLLKSFVVNSIVSQIQNDLSFERVTEFKRLTVVLVEISSMKSTASELISLADDCHKIILTVCENVGCIEDISLRESIIRFRIVFGIGNQPTDFNYCQFGVIRAWNLLHSLDSVIHVSGVSVGVSTGISCIAVIGHFTRQQYKIIGAPIIKTENMTRITQGKVICDMDTVVHSHISKSYFLSKGLVTLRGHKKDYIFYYTHRNEFEDRTMTELKDAYPLLGRFEEIELFSEILDDINILTRKYAGILIEGKNRIGKSRVLDGFAAIAKARQMAMVKIVVHPTFAFKPYAVIYKILEQMLEAEWCKTIDELEKNIIQKLGHVIAPEELCYMNRILRVRFKNSKQYLMDSDWYRHKKSLSILNKILKINNKQWCILLDNVEHIDYISWQFVSQAINHENVVLAMTMLEAKSWDELSRVEVDICRDKRLLRHTLTGLQLHSLSALACQFLGVQAVAVELHEYLLSSNKVHPGWVELFLSLMTLCCGFDIVKLTPDEAGEHRLIFPEILHTTRIPFDLHPEETAPPKSWNKRDRISVCLINEKFRMADSFINYSIRELSLEIYSRLSAYEQNVVRCAGVIGRVFLRNMLELILPNHESLKTASAIENLIRIRVFECALLQRQSTKVHDLTVCSFKPRSTFSDMHHLLRCRCHLQPIPPAEQHLARYAHCRFLEFKISIFLRVTQEQFAYQEKKKYHIIIAETYMKEAKKCVACGGGPFLKLPVEEAFRKLMKTPISTLDAYEAEQPTDDERIKETLVVDKEMKNTEVKDNDDSQASEATRISILPSSIGTDDLDEPVYCIMPESPKSARRMCKKSKVHPLAHEGTDQCLPFFGHLDFRYCRCLTIINCTFLKLQQHIRHINDIKKIIHFLMEYAAALIDFGQPHFALRFLALADERNEFQYVDTYSAWKQPALHGKMLRRSTILCLRGKAYILLGNYPQAETNYFEALSLFKHNFSASEWSTCHKSMYEKIRQNIRWTFRYPTIQTDAKEDIADIVRQNTALCLSLISSILMIKRHHKAAKLAALQSVVFGFSSYESSNFYYQCELYLSIFNIYGKLGDLSFISCVEKYILFAIGQKQKWNSEEIVILAYVYAAIFKVSLVRGNLERAKQFGEKALCISKYFNMIRLELEILPLLIQNLIRLKRLCKTVDTLQTLRDNALEDIDKSALTWYYALCVDLLLDAGVVVETYEVCANYALNIIADNAKVYILRDPNSTKRLISSLWLWQLRRSDLISSHFVKNLKFFTANIEVTNYSQVITICKMLECHLLLLTRCIDIKKGSQIELLLADIDTLMKILNDLAKTVECVKPHYYLLKSYYNLIRAHTRTSNTYWRKAKRCAEMQKNFMLLARIERNKTNWKAINSINNMTHFWEENIGFRNTIVWQDIDMFDLHAWSKLMYSLPIPDSHI